MANQFAGLFCRYFGQEKLLGGSVGETFIVPILPRHESYLCITSKANTKALVLQGRMISRTGS